MRLPIKHQVAVAEALGIAFVHQGIALKVVVEVCGIEDGIYWRHEEIIQGGLAGFMFI